MKLILLGPPGAGKGTQAKMLSQRLAIFHISTGDIFREAVQENSPLGLKVKGVMEKGELVPDKIVIKAVMDKIETHSLKKGFVLDGFPRTKIQAVELDNALNELDAPVDLVIYLRTSLKVSISRLSKRRVCPKCGFNYHLINIPPKEEGICDRCKVSLIHRPDDKEETIKKRLEVDLQESEELLNYYREEQRLEEVSGDLDSDEVFETLTKIFKEKKL